MEGVEDLRAWIGSCESVEDVATAAPLHGLAALLDHEASPWTKGEVAPLGHWLYFLPHARQSNLDADGHTRRGGFLPPVPLPRRMWAGSRISFGLPIPIGALMQRRSMITDVVSKAGRSGAMVFVKVQHEIHFEGRCALREDQDIVYRPMPDTAGGSPPSPDRTAAVERISHSTRELTLGTVELFRFSALTFNAHRIHYDRRYAREVEGYPDLVVQGPFLAMLLMDHFLRYTPNARITRFAFRAERALYDAVPFSVCLNARDRTADLWTLDRSGLSCMSATVDYQQQT
jgi:3-methylfumaryl-CoA hydratase